jgi:hypothetical protein
MPAASPAASPAIATPSGTPIVNDYTVATAVPTPVTTYGPAYEEP